MAKKKNQKLMVEMYFGVAGNGGDSGHWATEYVEIPLSTPKSKIETVAKSKFIKEWENNSKEDLAFCGVYNIALDTESHGLND